MKKVRILVVEDNQTWLEILCELIQSALPDVDLKQARDYKEAESLFRPQDWSLLVTDIGLPPDDGFVLGMRLAEQAKEKGVPCIVVSGAQAVTQQHVRNLFIKHQVLDFFSKDEFAKNIEKHTEFRNLVCSAVKKGSVISPSPRLESPVRRITIGINGDVFYLVSDGVEKRPISLDLRNLFSFFVRNVCDDFPAKVVESRILNRTVDPPNDDERASPPLRAAIGKLNNEIRQLTSTPEKIYGIENMRNHGYCLNARDFQWEAEKEVAECFRSTRSIPVDPQTMDENTPDREHRLPARPKRKPPSTEDNDS